MPIFRKKANAMLINGYTELIAHIGYPTHSFKSPLIYNPYFASAGINMLVVPMGCQANHFEEVLHSIFQLSNIRGALITMPHKVKVVSLLDEVSAKVKVAGACNAVKRLPDGRLHGDMFDGEGFVRGVLRKGFILADKRCLVVGSGGVGCAIAASLAEQDVAEIALFDVNAASSEALASRIRQHFPQVKVQTECHDPAGYDLVVNATPLGMNAWDALPVDVSRLSPESFVGEVVMSQQMTAFLQAAAARGCRTQVGTDMLFEQIPAYLEYFDLPCTTAEKLREVSLA
jgi:shikimate dehydrogenase